MTPLSAMFQSELVVKIDRYLFAHHHDGVIYLKHPQQQHQLLQ